MTRMRWIFWLHLLVAAGSLLVGYALAGSWLVGLPFVLLAAMWAVAQYRLRRFSLLLGGTVMFLCVFAAAVGTWAGIPTWSGLLAVAAALGAWDLDHFLRRLEAAGDVDLSSGLGRSHLRHLLAVELVGIAAGLLALAVRLRLPFWWEALLVALVVIGLAQVISHLRAQVGDEPAGEDYPVE